MPQSILEHVFEPFFTTKDVGQGTSLGLSQIYGFIKQSNGHIAIYSEPDHGTAVKLYLPRLPDSSSHAPEPEAAREAPPRGNGELIMVVEDDDAVRTYTTETLRELGYRLLVATDGQAGLEMLAQNAAIRLLVTDIGLPGGMTGRQLADAARRVKPDLPVLFTTGYSRNAIVHGSILVPGTQMLPKPFTYVALAAKIRSMLDG
jgi:CheY-like chemotaxis protein